MKIYRYTLPVFNIFNLYFTVCTVNKNRIILCLNGFISLLVAGYFTAQIECHISGAQRFYFNSRICPVKADAVRQILITSHNLNFLFDSIIK